MGERDVFADAHPQHQALALAVFGDERDARFDRGMRPPHQDALPGDVDLARLRNVGAGNRAYDLGAARTDQPRQPDDLTGANFERDVAWAARRVQPANAQRNRRIGGNRRQIREVRAETAADH